MIEETIYQLAVNYSGWIAFVVSVIGTVLVISPDDERRVKGYEIWLYGNVIWVIYAILNNNLPVLLINIAYGTLSLMGIYRNIKIPDKDK
jgi:hypothetical protein